MPAQLQSPPRWGSWELEMWGGRSGRAGGVGKCFLAVRLPVLPAKGGNSSVGLPVLGTAPSQLGRRQSRLLAPGSRGLVYGLDQLLWEKVCSEARSWGVGGVASDACGPECPPEGEGEAWCARLPGRLGGWARPCGAARARAVRCRPGDGTVWVAVRTVGSKKACWGGLLMRTGGKAEVHVGHLPGWLPAVRTEPWVLVRALQIQGPWDQALQPPPAPQPCGAGVAAGGRWVSHSGHSHVTRRRQPLPPPPSPSEQPGSWPAGSTWRTTGLGAALGIGRARTVMAGVEDKLACSLALPSGARSKASLATWWS